MALWDYGLAVPVPVRVPLAVASSVSFRIVDLPLGAGLGWFCLQLIAHGDGREPDRALSGEAAIRGYVDNEEKTAAALQRRA